MDFETAKGKYQLIHKIGKGSCGKVYLAERTSSAAQSQDASEKTLFAVKVFLKEQLIPQIRRSIDTEVEALSCIKGENVIFLEEVHEDENRVFIVLEYCNGGDLQQVINLHE